MNLSPTRLPAYALLPVTSAIRSSAPMATAGRWILPIGSSAKFERGASQFFPLDLMAAASHACPTAALPPVRTCMAGDTPATKKVPTPIVAALLPGATASPHRVAGRLCRYRARAQAKNRHCEYHQRRQVPQTTQERHRFLLLTVFTLTT